MRRLDPAILHRLGLDAMAADQVEGEGGAVADQADQLFALVAPAILGRDGGDDVVGVDARQCRDDLAIVAP